MNKKVVYIAGPITGRENYEENFLDMEFELARMGNIIALSPAALPPGMSRAQYMRICFAMIDCADAVILLDRWQQSEGARLERQYCAYIGKPHTDSLEELKYILQTESEVETNETGETSNQSAEEPTMHCRVRPRRVAGGTRSAAQCCVCSKKR